MVKLQVCARLSCLRCCLLLTLFSPSQAQNDRLKQNEEAAHESLRQNNLMIRKVRARSCNPYLCSQPDPSPTTLKEQRQQDVAKQALREANDRMESRMRLENWKTGIKQRACTHLLLREQVLCLTIILALNLTLSLTPTHTVTLYADTHAGNAR